MMCDFKPGDEVTLDRVVRWTQRAPSWMFWTRWRHGMPGPIFGVVYTVDALGVCPAERLPDPEKGDLVVLKLREIEGWHSHRRFRKVQRRDLTAWLKTAIGNTDKLDKRQTKKVRA